MKKEGMGKSTGMDKKESGGQESVGQRHWGTPVSGNTPKGKDFSSLPSDRRL